MLAQAILERLPSISRDVTQPIESRVDALISAMTLEEKVSQMLHESPAIERLGIPAYNWWNECSHGVARAGRSTVFPHAIGLAATWDTDLLDRIGRVISDEARAKHHEAVRKGIVKIYGGLTFWTPNINIVRDPRWGRAQETFGEDTFLTARLAVVFVKALQGDHPEYIKIAACAKHFAAHSGPEALRHSFDAKVSPHDLWDTYLPAFEACVREAKVESVMGAYTRTNGEACCASPTLIGDILRTRWQFAGHFVSDCGAIEDISEQHLLVDSHAAAAALAVRAGCDLCCGCAYQSLAEAIEQGLVTEEQLDLCLRRLFKTRFRLGMFDPADRVPYAHIPIEVVGQPSHRALARQAACESLVLLKNTGILPLSNHLHSIAVIGPNAHDLTAQLGNYHGTPVQPLTILEGIQQAIGDGTQVHYVAGCDITVPDESGFAAAISAAQESDVVIFVGGLSQVLEGEDLQDEGVPLGTTSQGDRITIELPSIQEKLLRELHATGKPVVLILLGGSALAIPWADSALAAIVQAWYPGEAGEAVADVLFGTYTPAGRLPLTFYRSTDDLPDFKSYDMRGRTYRYFEGEALYPFGYGLSYTTFRYSSLDLSAQSLAVGDSLRVLVEITNTGSRAGDEVVQLYVRRLISHEGRIPCWALRGFERIHLKVGEKQTAVFELDAKAFASVTEAGETIVNPGDYEICVGGHAPVTGKTGLHARITLW
jgi:beta-glucosidase